jgi:electron transfer flavoprotein alpha subunit
MLTYIAISDGKVKRSSLEVLSNCKSLADQHHFACEAVIIDEDATSFTNEVAKFGASKIYTISGNNFKNHHNGALLRALATAIKASSPKIVAFASTESTKDILGALATHVNAGVVADVSSFSIDGPHVKAQRPMMAAKIMGNVNVSGDTILVSVRPGSYDLNEHPTNAEVLPLNIELSPSDVRSTLKEIISATGNTIDLNEAEAIVAAGRGVKDDEAKALISELATVLNAGVGASRALTEAGIYDPSLQIGQTGKVVSPQLYIAVGISGAIQHVAGMANSKVIVAINKEADAPIFEVADYGIVGDLYKVLPPFIEEIKRIKK